MEHDVTLPVKSTDRKELVIPKRIRERYLTPEAEDRDARVQAVGSAVRVIIPSDRETLVIYLPTDGWATSDEGTRSFGQGRIAITPWFDDLQVEEETITAALEGIEPPTRYELL